MLSPGAKEPGLGQGDGGCGVSRRLCGGVAQLAVLWWVGEDRSDDQAKTKEAKEYHREVVGLVIPAVGQWRTVIWVRHFYASDTVSLLAC